MIDVTIPFSERTAIILAGTFVMSVLPILGLVDSYKEKEWGWVFIFSLTESIPIIFALIATGILVVNFT